MTDKEVVKLQIWIEKTYGENAIVRNNSKSSIMFNSSYIDRDGVDIHTDGVVECNSKDKFGKIIISGYKYAMLCLHGKEFSGISTPRIIIYCNANCDYAYRHYKRAIRGVLNNYRE